MSTTTALCLLTGLATAATPGFNPDEWLEGAPGLAQGLDAAEAEGRPLLVYFYADWCGYCRQLEGQLLGTPEVKAYLADGFAVRINPEKGQRESELARQHGIRGYPALFVYGHSSKRLVPVDRMEFKNGRPQLLKPAPFIDRLIDASER